jgi:hypothetical protein
MPKVGLTDAMWEKRLALVATHKIKLSTGQNPGKGTSAEKKLKEIKACPKFNVSNLESHLISTKGKTPHETKNVNK